MQGPERDKIYVQVWVCETATAKRRNNTSFEWRRRAYRRSKIIELAVCNIICYHRFRKCHQHHPELKGISRRDGSHSLTRTVLSVRFIDFAIYLNLIYWTHLVRNGYGRFTLWHIRQLKNCSSTECTSVTVVLVIWWKRWRPRDSFLVRESCGDGHTAVHYQLHTGSLAQSCNRDKWRIKAICLAPHNSHKIIISVDEDGDCRK